MGRYAKSIAVVLTTIVYAVQAALSDGTITATELGVIVTTALTAAGVYYVPNRVVAWYAKAAVAGLVAAVIAVQAAVSGGGITGTEWGGIITAVISAVLVFLAKNARPVEESRI